MLPLIRKIIYFGYQVFFIFQFLRLKLILIFSLGSTPIGAKGNGEGDGQIEIKPLMQYQQTPCHMD